MTTRLCLLAIVALVCVGSLRAAESASAAVTGCINENQTPYRYCQDGDGCAKEANCNTQCPNPNHEPPTGNTHHSYIDFISGDHLHDTVDYATERPFAGSPSSCSSCGGGSSLTPTDGLLERLHITRYHHSRDSWSHTSFGGTWFGWWDTTLALNADSYKGTGVPEVVVVFADQAGHEHHCFEVDSSVGDNATDGVYHSTRNTFRSVTLYDSTGTVTATQAAAATAVLTYHDGHRLVFEIVSIDSTLRGRLIRREDRNGNALVVSYAFPANASDSTLNYNRRQLWKVSTITDPYGKSAAFTYQQATGWGGQWFIQSIALPNATTLSYTYTSGKIASVSYPDGTAAAYTYGWDSTLQADTVTYDDPGAEGTHRRKTGYYTSSTYVDPVTHLNISQAYGIAIKIVNGAGETSFRRWQSAQDTGLYYLYTGGTQLARIRYDYGTITAMAYATNYVYDPTSVLPDLSAVRFSDDYTTTANGGWLERTSATDPFQRIWTFAPHAVNRGQYTSYAYPDGTTTTQTVNTFGDAVNTTDRLGRVTARTYDANGNVLTVTEASGTGVQGTTTFTYNSLGQILSKTDANNHTTDYGYDAGHHLVSITEPPDVTAGARATRSFAYDSIGRLASASDASGRTVTYAYDNRNRVTTVTYPDASTETYAYGSGTAANLLVQRSDRNGNVEAIGYDGAGRETSHTWANGQPEAVSKTCSYLVGTDLRVSCTDRGEQTDYTYDYRQRLVATTRHPRVGVSLTEAMVYDAASRRVAATDAYGRSTWFVYDVNDRMVRSVQGLIPEAISRTATLTGYDATALATSAWTNSDIGTSGQGGSTSVSGGVYTITGKNDIGGSADNFQYERQLCVSDAVVIARVTGQTNTDGNAKAGVMYRSSTASNAAMVALSVTPGQSLLWQVRTARGYSASTATVSTGVALPVWLKLERVGSTIIGSTSSDGSTWTVLRSVVVPAGPQGTIGLCVASKSWMLSTATFDTVSVAKSGPVSNVAHDQAWASQLLAWSRSDPNVIITDRSYDAEGNPLTATDGRGTVTANSYDARNRLVQRIEAQGTAVQAATSYEYDAVGNRTATVDARAVRTEYLYAGRDLLAGMTEAVGLPEQATTAYGYTPTRKKAVEVDARGHATIFRYGVCCDRLVQVEDPLHFLTNVTYDAFGNQLTTTDPNGNVTARTYDHLNRVISLTNGAGETTGYAYDDNLSDGVGIDAAIGARLSDLGFAAGSDGSAVKVTDAEGEVSYVIRDGLGRTVRTLDANANQTTTAYDATVAMAIGGANGLLGVSGATATVVETAVTDALGHATRQRSDGAGRTLATLDALGKLTRAAHDAAGNRVQQLDANGVGDTCVYDARNRRTGCTDTHGDGTGASYDAVGNVVATTDGFGHATVFAFDGRNRKTSMTDRIGATTTYTYDATNNLTAITDAQGGATSYGYDDRNLLISESFPGTAGGTRSYAYDAGRRLLTRTDQASVVTAYVYDHADRLTARQYPDGKPDTFSYDHVGRLLTAASARYANTVIRRYDPASRLSEESLVVPGSPEQGTTVRYDLFYGYDNANRQTLIAYPDGTQVARGYTERNQLASVTYGGASVATRAYDDGMRLTSTTSGNGLVETRAYRSDASGKDNLPASIAVPGVTSFTYTYDADKRATQETDGIASGQSQTLAYDGQDRLTSWSRSSGDTQTWSLSPVGDWDATTVNSVTETRTHNSVHEITAIGSAALSYDAKGNLTADSLGASYAWDVENRLAAAPAAGATYAYDALGRRVQKVVAGLTTTFVSGAQEVYEVDTDESVYDAIAANGGPGTSDRPLGGVLSGSGVIRVNFQPASTSAPTGFIADSGAAYGLQPSGATYGWQAGAQAYTAERDRVPLVPFDTLDEMQHASTADGVWEYALANGDYPVVVVMGDAANLDMANHLTIEGTACTDPDPYDPLHDYGYQQGDFDGYAVIAHVTDGKLTIAPGSGASKAKICFVEIGPAGGSIDAATQQRLADLVRKMTDATAATPPKKATRSNVFGSYVDEPLAVVSNGVRYYLHSNRLYSVAAATDASGAVVERYKYDAYGRRGISSGSGVSLTATAIGNEWGFTGRRHDDETGLVYMRSRTHSPSLGRFLERDPLTAQSNNVGMGVPDPGEGYYDGMSLYAAFFIPNGIDPTGMVDVQGCTMVIWIGHQGNNDTAANTALKDTEDKLKRTKDPKTGKQGGPGKSFRIGFVCCHGDEYNNHLTKDYPENAITNLPPESGFGVKVPPGSTLADANSKLRPELREPGNFDMAKAITAAINSAEDQSPSLCGCCKNVTIVVHCADSHPGSADPHAVTNLCGQQITVPCDWLTSSSDPKTEWGHGRWVPSPKAP